MRRTKSWDSCAVPGSRWRNSRSSEKGPARIRLGRSLTGCEGARSSAVTILGPNRDCEVEGPGGRRSGKILTWHVTTVPVLLLRYGRASAPVCYRYEP